MVFCDAKGQRSEFNARELFKGPIGIQGLGVDMDEYEASLRPTTSCPL